MATNRCVIGAFAAAVGLVPTPVSAASAVPDHPAACHIEVRNRWDPGAWMTRQTSGTFTSKDGTVVCTGAMGDRQLAPHAGRITWTVRYLGDCISGRGSGTWQASLPTAAGAPINLSGPVEVAWTAVFGVTISGRFGRSRVQGVGEVRNDTEQDPIVEEDVSCFTVPIRHDIWTGQILVGSAGHDLRHGGAELRPPVGGHDPGRPDEAVEGH